MNKLKKINIRLEDLVLEKQNVKDYWPQGDQTERLNELKEEESKLKKIRERSYRDWLDKNNDSQKKSIKDAAEQDVGQAKDIKARRERNPEEKAAELMRAASNAYRAHENILVHHRNLEGYEEGMNKYVSDFNMQAIRASESSLSSEERERSKKIREIRGMLKSNSFLQQPDYTVDLPRGDVLPSLSLNSKTLRESLEGAIAVKFPHEAYPNMSASGQMAKAAEEAFIVAARLSFLNQNIPFETQRLDHLQQNLEYSQGLLEQKKISKSTAQIPRKEKEIEQKKQELRESEIERNALLKQAQNIIRNNMFLKQNDYTIRVDCGNDGYKRYNSSIIRDRLTDLTK